MSLACSPRLEFSLRLAQLLIHPRIGMFQVLIDPVKVNRWQDSTSHSGILQKKDCM